MTRSLSVRAALVAVLLTAGNAAGQVRQPPAGGIRPRAAMLREQISQVFMQRARNQLGLTDDQAQRMQKVVGQWADTRLQLEANEHELMQALHGQMRPGMPAIADSVSRLVDALAANRVADANSFQNELHDLKGILNPVQLGQFYLIQDQLMTKIRELELQRQQQGAPLGRGGRAGGPPGGG